MVFIHYTLTPEKFYQKTSRLNSLSRSLISVLNPLIATAFDATLPGYGLPNPKGNCCFTKQKK